jgi:hypothetical protein
MNIASNMCADNSFTAVVDSRQCIYIPRLVVLAFPISSEKGLRATSHGAYQYQFDADINADELFSCVSTRYFQPWPLVLSRVLIRNVHETALMGLSNPYLKFG